MKWISVKEKLPEQNTKVFVFDPDLPHQKYHLNITVASWSDSYCFSCKKRKVFDNQTRSYFFENEFCTDHGKIIWNCSFNGEIVHPTHWMPFFETPHQEVGCENCEKCGK